MSQRLVTDIEVYFRGEREPACFTCDESRGDLFEAGANGDRRYRLQVGDGLEEVHIISGAEVRYMRLTQRYADTPSATYIGDGVSVSGEPPLPD